MPEKKAAPEGGKTLEFVCAADCVYQGARRRKGDVVTAAQCPPHFIAKPESEGKKP